MNTAKRYARWLWLLLGLFCFRVAAQFVTLAGTPSFLPPFDAWHSGVLPYGALVTAQIVIIVVFGWTASRFSGGNVRPRRTLGLFLASIGLLYFAVMLVRLVLGLTLFSTHPWFGKLLPTVFHLVLASFLLLVGAFHLRAGRLR